MAKSPKPLNDEEDSAGTVGPEGEVTAEPRVICFCHLVTDETLRKAIAEGATTLELIKERTAASTGCTGCENAVQEILDEMLGKSGKTKP